MIKNKITQETIKTLKQLKQINNELNNAIGDKEWDNEDDKRILRIIRKKNMETIKLIVDMDLTNQINIGVIDEI